MQRWWCEGGSTRGGERERKGGEAEVRHVGNEAIYYIDGW